MGRENGHKNPRPIKDQTMAKLHRTAVSFLVLFSSFFFCFCFSGDPLFPFRVILICRPLWSRVSEPGPYPQSRRRALLHLLSSQCSSGLLRRGEIRPIQASTVPRRPRRARTDRCRRRGAAAAAAHLPSRCAEGGCLRSGPGGALG